jgi:hypothetical protein
MVGKSVRSLNLLALAGIFYKPSVLFFGLIYYNRWAFTLQQYIRNCPGPGFGAATNWQLPPREPLTNAPPGRAY